MDELKLVVASNLIKLRQTAGMTQAELGVKINYSDKTVSKWERGESIPDAYVLMRLAAIYDTTVDWILSPAEKWQDPVDKQKAEKKAAQPKFSGGVVCLVSVAAIWTLSVTLFVVFWLALDTLPWLVFATAVPVSLVAVLVFNSIWNKGRYNAVIVMLLIATIVALIYLFLLPFNPWQVFLILIPAELLAYLCFHIRGGIFRKH